MRDESEGEQIVGGMKVSGDQTRSCGGPFSSHAIEPAASQLTQLPTPCCRSPPRRPARELLPPCLAWSSGRSTEWW
jgi:hypothetical protein